MGNGSQSPNRNGNVMGERIASMQQTANDHTAQLRDLTSTVNDLQIGNARISTMQENSSDEVKEIHRQHEAFVESQRLRSEQTDEAIKDLSKMIHTNNVKLAEDFGRNAEKHRLTTIMMSGLIVLTAVLSGAAQVYFK